MTYKRLAARLNQSITSCKHHREWSALIDITPWLTLPKKFEVNKNNLFAESVMHLSLSIKKLLVILFIHMQHDIDINKYTNYVFFIKT